jgi:hypothetical protein
MSQESIHFFMSTVSTSKHKKGVNHRTHSNDPDNDVGANSYVLFLCLQHNARMYLGNSDRRGTASQLKIRMSQMYRNSQKLINAGLCHSYFVARPILSIQNKFQA